MEFEKDGVKYQVNIDWALHGRSTQESISAYLTTAQVAAMTGEKLATIKKRCERGSLPALRWDGRYMIHIDDVTPQKGEEMPTTELCGKHHKPANECCGMYTTYLRDKGKEG